MGALKGMGSSRMAAPGKEEVFDFSKTLVGDDAVGMLSKLVWEIRQIHEYAGGEPIVRGFLSYNAAATAWHTHEWIWKLCPEAMRDTLLDQVNAPSRDERGYRLGLQATNGAFAICRQIATAGKHVGVAYNRDDISGEIHHNRESGETFVQFRWDGKVVRDTDVYVEVLGAWIRIYVALGFKQAELMNLAARELFGERAPIEFPAPR